MNGKPRVSFTFPIRWVNDPEDRKFLSENLVRSIRRGGLKDIYQASPTDAYYAQFGQTYTPYYMVIIRIHAYQPPKLKLTQNQLETALKPAFPTAKLANFNTFFVQEYDTTALPLLEMEIYY